MRLTQSRDYPHERTCNCTHFKHICTLPLVHRPKDVLLVITFMALHWVRQSTALRKIGLRCAGENLGWLIDNHILISG